MCIDIETQEWETKTFGPRGQGRLWKCYWKWENMNMNQLQEWKQSQNGFGFVAVSSGNIAVGGLWLHDVRKSTQSFLSSPNYCWSKLRRTIVHVEGCRQLRNNNSTLLPTYSCEMLHVEWEKVSIGQGERRMDSFFEGTHGGCCVMAPLTAAAFNYDQLRNYPEREKIAQLNLTAWLCKQKIRRKPGDPTLRDALPWCLK